MPDAYNQNDLGYLTYTGAHIRSAATALAPNSNFSLAEFEQAIAASLVEEYHDRYEWRWEHAGQTQVQQNLADWFAQNWWSESDYQSSYTYVQANNFPFPQVPSLNDKFNNPIIIDVGPGNIQIFTAINLINDYLSQNPGDPLNLGQYNGNITGLVQDLTDPRSPATAAVAGLMVVRAENWFSTNASNWSQLSPDEQVAMVLTFYNRGERWFDDYRNQQIQSTGSYVANPQSAPEASEYLYNSNAIANALADTTTTWDPITWQNQFSAIPPCFAAGTPIVLADGTAAAIDSIRVGDLVAAFDEREANGAGALTPARVTRLIPGVTTEWIVLDDGTRVTPGHRYLRPDGAFAPINDILADDGLVVDADGQTRRITATLLRAEDTGSDATWITPEPVDVGGACGRRDGCDYENRRDVLKAFAAAALCRAGGRSVSRHRSFHMYPGNGAAKNKTPRRRCST